ncbi:unnamed protein product [Parascedosporium putredinis]|uniref:F-box domain-containing protein n=1 Tax=Parascedosporium putredinis TaxID=1442378 RepID=A0A9P1GUQ6_9PEZI|nr:unnamed protein product [Parascedosporium putredinis]CAI7987752.1 unnamed protein product [Parascedosporium putredinis]
MALVSKQFYALVKTPHAWKIAFQRLYSNKSLAGDDDFDPIWDDQGNDATPVSEYILRSQLLRGLANGRPSAAVDRSGRLVKRFNAILTYDSRIPCVVTNVYADFTSQKSPPKVIHGGADLGMGSMSNPLTGKIEKWGISDVHTLAQVEDLFPNLPMYGIAEGPASGPNVMDVSPTFGFIVGEGFPGGFADVPVSSPDEALSSVWISKYNNVPMLTHTMVGMMTGSTTGIVTSYALGRETGRRRFQDGDMACRWALSPGVPIISLKVDEGYSFARRAAGRVWAVALNALGEVFTSRMSLSQRLEVDFAADDGQGAGEAIFVIDCGYASTQPARIQRYTRNIPNGIPQSTGKSSAKARRAGPDGWAVTSASLRGDNMLKITASALDTSHCALTTLPEDPLVSASTGGNHVEIPGDRGRFLAVGTDRGTVMLWNGRDPSTSSLSLVKLIHTESPEVSSLALSALYLVHGGSDGLVQAWDPLSANKAPIRTINTRSGNRVPRHLAHINPALRNPQNSQYSAATSICLHPDPTKLCGVVAFGAFIRSWSYGSAAQSSSRKRAKAGLKTCELEDGEQASKREQWLKAKFGPGDLGDLTEEEAVLYALMMSEESFVEEEFRRVTSDTGSYTGEGPDSPSSSFSTAAGNPSELDLSILAAEGSASVTSEDFSADFYQSGDPFIEDYFGSGSPSASSSPGQFGFPITFKKKGKKSKKPSPGSRSGSPP